MAIYCMNCGTSLPDDAVFCLKCGKQLKGISTSPATHKPKVEYKVVELHWDQKPFVEVSIYLEERDKQKFAQEPILKRLKPYFDVGWQFDGTYNSAINPVWETRGFMQDKDRLRGATVRLIRYC